jgi:hypothetical protein
MPLHNDPMFGFQMVGVTSSLIDKHGGKVLQKYCQGDDDRVIGDDFSRGKGWCLGVAIHWLRMKKSGGDFFGWLQTDEAASSFRVIMAQQYIAQDVARHQKSAGHVTQEAHDDFANRSMNRLRKFRLEFVGKYEAENLNSSQLIADTLSDPNEFGPFCIIHFVKAAGGGHTVAAYAPQCGGLILMDPNVGEVSFNRKRGFVGFFDEYGKDPGLNYFPMVKCVVEKYR